MGTVYTVVKHQPIYFLKRYTDRKKSEESDFFIIISIMGTFNHFIIISLNHLNSTPLINFHWHINFFRYFCLTVQSINCLFFYWLIRLLWSLIEFVAVCFFWELIVPENTTFPFHYTTERENSNICLLYCSSIQIGSISFHKQNRMLSFSILYSSRIAQGDPAAQQDSL